MFLILSSIYFSLQIIGFSLLCEYYPENEPPNETTPIINADTDEDIKYIGKNDEVNSLGVRYLSSQDGLTLSQTFKQPFFFMLAVIMSTSTIAPGLVVTYYKVFFFYKMIRSKMLNYLIRIKTFGQTFISNDKFLATVGSVSSIFNATGRLLWGYLIDRLPFKVLTIFVYLDVI